MRKTFLALVLVVLIGVAFTLPSVVAQYGQDRSERMKDRWEALSEAKKARAMEKGERAKMFSKCTHFGNGTVASRFVKFHYAPDIGAVHDLTLRTDRNETTKFFKEIKPLPFNSTERPFVTGAVFHHADEDLTIRGHCNPTAVFGWWNDNGTRTLTFTLADNATATLVSTKEARVNVSSTHGHILASGNGTILVAGSNVTVTLADNDKAMFRAHPAMGVAKSLHEQNAAFRSGKLGAIVNLVNVEGTAVDDSEDVDVETEAKEIAKGKLVLAARATVSGNRVIYITVDGETFEVARRAHVRVTVGGVAATNATSADAVANATGAAVHVTEVDAALQIVVNVPHFSEQEIEVQQATSDGDDGAGGTGEGTGTPGFGSVALLVAALGVLLVRRRR